MKPMKRATKEEVANELARAMYQQYRELAGNSGWPHWKSLRPTRKYAWVLAAKFAMAQATPLRKRAKRSGR